VGYQGHAGRLGAVPRRRAAHTAAGALHHHVVLYLRRRQVAAVAPSACPSATAQCVAVAVLARIAWMMPTGAVATCKREQVQEEDTPAPSG
jgi:hypothetical protein